MMDFSQFPTYQNHLHQKIIAVDYGSTVCGLAGIFPGFQDRPTGKGRIITKGDSLKLVSEKIVDFLEEEDANVLVLGNPIRSQGETSETSKAVIELKNLVLLSLPNLEIFLQDEHLTTQAAKDRMKESSEYGKRVDLQKIDEVSAIIILEDFLKN